MATSWLEINLSRLDANIAGLRRLLTPHGAPATKLCGVVKADAYGLGASMIARRLTQRGVDMLAVFSPEQAEDLAAMSLACPLLVMMQVHELNRHDLLYHAASLNRLHLTIHDSSQVYDLERSAQGAGLRIPVHVYIDTGMSRAGVSPDEAPQIIREVLNSRSLRLAGVYTHLANTDGDPTLSDDQIKLYDRVIDSLGKPLPTDVLMHVANTAGTIRDSRYHRGMVRIGIGMYGYGVDLPAHADGQNTAGNLALAALGPVARWVSSVIHTRHYARGTPVGYNSTHRLKRDSILGVVPVGYADGYPLILSNLAVVDLPEHSDGSRTRSAPVIGRVNMDQIIIDLTDIPGAGVKTQVELFSNDPASPCSLPQLAKLAHSSCYEMLSRIPARLTRKYVSVEVGKVVPAIPRVPTAR